MCIPEVAAAHTGGTVFERGNLVGAAPLRKPWR
jgi:hypothetical protein